MAKRGVSPDSKRNQRDNPIRLKRWSRRKKKKKTPQSSPGGERVRRLEIAQKRKYRL